MEQTFFSQGKRTADWEKWKAIPVVRLWEAVALSFNTDPAHVRRQSIGTATGRSKFDESKSFNDRIDIVEANAGNHLPIWGYEPSDFLNSTVKLVVFASFAHDMEWLLPEQFPYSSGHKLTSHQIAIWKSKSIWTEIQAAFLLLGREPHDEAPLTGKISEAAKQVIDAVDAGDVKCINQATIKMPGSTKLRPKDVIAWAPAVLFPKFPYLERQEFTIIDAKETRGVNKNCSSVKGSPDNSPIPVPRSTAQEVAISEILKMLNYDLKRLPPSRGKPGAKAATWEKLKTKKNVFVSYGVFDGAWARLRKRGEICDAE